MTIAGASSVYSAVPVPILMDLRSHLADENGTSYSFFVAGADGSSRYEQGSATNAGPLAVAGNYT